MHPTEAIRTDAIRASRKPLPQRIVLACATRHTCLHSICRLPAHTPVACAARTQQAAAGLAAQGAKGAIKPADAREAAQSQRAREEEGMVEMARRQQKVLQQQRALGGMSKPWRFDARAWRKAGGGDAYEQGPQGGDSDSDGSSRAAALAPAPAADALVPEALVPSAAGGAATDAQAAAAEAQAAAAEAQAAAAGHMATAEAQATEGAQAAAEDPRAAAETLAAAAAAAAQAVGKGGVSGQEGAAGVAKAAPVAEGAQEVAVQDWMRGFVLVDAAMQVWHKPFYCVCVHVFLCVHVRVCSAIF